MTLWLSSSDLNCPPRSIYVLFVCPLALSVSKSYHAKSKLPSKTYLYLVCLSINIVCKQIVLMLRISCPPRCIYMYVLFVCLLTLSVKVRGSLVSPHLLSSCFKTVKVYMQVLIDCQYLLTRNIWHWLIVMIQVMVKVMTQFMMRVMTQFTMQVRSWLNLLARPLESFETFTDDPISFVKSPQKDSPESFETLYSWPHFLCQIDP